MSEGRAAPQRESVRAAYDRGCTDAQISEICGVTCEMVENWRKCEGLPRNRSRAGPIPKLDWDEAQRLYDQGFTDSEIAEACGASKRNVQHWRYRHDLPCHRHGSNRRRRKKAQPMAQLVADAAAARAHGMNYGVYYATYIAPQREAEAKVRGGKS